MPIDKSQYQSIIQNLKIGNSVAEHDALLEQARVETPIFSGVLNDDFDVVLGRKGAGKTAMFKIINILSNFLLLKRNIVVLSGVNSSGESMFNEYKDRLATFDEHDFETFWKFYFIYLIYNEFLQDPKFHEGLVGCDQEVKYFISECSKAGVPTFPAKQEKRQILQWLVSIFSPKVKKVKVDVTMHSQTPGLFTISPEVEFEQSETTKEQTAKAVYVNDIAKALKAILVKSGFKIWIFLDRLDEVFDRYSSVEFKGLRGLLIAYKSFNVDEDKDLLKIKLFLRDDIVEFLTNDKIYKKYFGNKNIPPLPAATHIFAKQSPILNWSEDEIEQLILNRLLLNDKLRKYVGIEEEKTDDEVKDIMRIKSERQLYWDRIFPKTISTSKSIKWMFTRLKDANGIVTPRSVIDMLEAATAYQRKKLSINFEDCDYIFPVDAIKEGLAIASKNKLEKDIYNEFPKEQENIKKLAKEGKIKLSKTDLKNIYGKNWEDTIANLSRMGIVKYVKDSDTFRVEYIFRPALGLAYST